MNKRGSKKDMSSRIAILGAGNIGLSIARGLAASGYRPQDIILTRRRVELLAPLKAENFNVLGNNLAAIKDAGTVILAVGPQQLESLIKEIRPALVKGERTVISIVSGVSTDRIMGWIKKRISLVRAMSNTAIAIREAMTCLCAAPENSAALARAKEIFDTLGKTVIIKEELMLPATALTGCGVAFFLRSIRAASQGGIQIGFHSDEALFMAAQTAKGAAALLLQAKNHPEKEIDKVTTPCGCTIEGLNEMEHNGFSSAMITGIVTSNTKAASLYKKR